MFQRSAPWTLPKFDTAYRGVAQRLYERSPRVQGALRSAWRGSLESLAPVFTGRPPLRARASSALATALSDLQRRVQFRGDPALRAATRPDYPLGCKRILITSDWYRALARPDVELVTSPIGEVRADGIVTADGRLHEADVVIFGTGFTATQFLAPMEVTGRDGASLRDTWAAGAEAYFGMTVPRFPNMFVIYGPEHGARDGLGDRHARGAGRLRRAGAAACSPAAPQSGSRCARTSTTASSASSRSACSRRSGRRAAAAGT